MYVLMSCSAETASRVKSKLFMCLFISSAFREITTLIGIGQHSCGFGSRYGFGFGFAFGLGFGSCKQIK